MSYPLWYYRRMIMNDELKIFRVGFVNEDAPLFVKADGSVHALEIAKRITGLDACIASQILIHDENGMMGQ